MSKRLVTDLDVKGKKAIVRVDFNVPHSGDTITDDNRIVAALPTIKHLVDKGAKVILLSHLGKVDHKDPEKTESDKKKNNMAPVAKKLQEHLPDTKVTFVDATRGEKLEKAIADMKDGEVLLMQNTRYEPGESKNDPELGKYWASLGDLYVSDAFGSVHRAHASTVGIPSHLPSAVGFLIEKELKYLGEGLDKPRRPYIAVVGGSKVSDKIGVINSLLDKADKVLLGGAMIFTFYQAMGLKTGDSLMEADKIDVAKEFIKKGGDRLVLPVDVVVAEKFDDAQDIKVVDCDKIPDHYWGLDIGPKSVELFAKHLDGAHTVFWNGPMGVFEKPEYAKGTIGVCKAIAGLDDCVSIIGGGDSASAAKNLGYADKFSHISTGGGASLEYVEGKELPGIDIIEEKK